MNTNETRWVNTKHVAEGFQPYLETVDVDRMLQSKGKIQFLDNGEPKFLDSRVRRNQTKDSDGYIRQGFEIEESLVIEVQPLLRVIHDFRLEEDRLFAQENMERHTS